MTHMIRPPIPCTERMPRVGDVLEHTAGIRVVVVTEPVEFTEADEAAGWAHGCAWNAPFRCAAREAQDSPRRMPEEWWGCISVPGVWQIVGRES